MTGKLFYSHLHIKIFIIVNRAESKFFFNTIGEVVRTGYQNRLVNVYFFIVGLRLINFNNFVQKLV